MQKMAQQCAIFLCLKFTNFLPDVHFLTHEVMPVSRYFPT